MNEKNVCSSGWHGDHGSIVTLKNHTNGPVTVSADSTCTWPFPKEKSPFTINANKSKDVLLADDAKKSYCYDTKGCPGDPKDVNPKTVIID
jgi:hypothetical protein